jgi:hypothetical protein
MYSDLDRHKQDRLVFPNHIHFSTLRTRTEMVSETLVFSPFNQLTLLIARENFITASIHLVDGMEKRVNHDKNTGKGKSKFVPVLN